MAQSIRTVGIIGAGQMGNGIAHVCALAGIPVVLNDIASTRLKEALATINGNMARQVARKRITEDEKDAALKRISTAREQRWACRLRSRHRGRNRKGRRQAQDLRRALPGAQARRDRGDQHLVDLDHAACRRDRPAGQVHRHPLHESGAADGAGRAHSRHCHRRRYLRNVQSVCRPSSARPSRWPRTSRPSSSTASCCR